MHAGVWRPHRHALGAARGIWPFRKFLVSRGHKVPTFIPAANEFAEKFASLAGGTAMSMLAEILFNVPGTGALSGRLRHRRLARARCGRLSQPRLSATSNMYVCDGSVVAANLGVNPSLTITALSRARHELHSAGAGDGVEETTRPRWQPN